MNRSHLRLGFYYHIPVVQDKERILVPGYLGRFLDCLAAHCAEIYLFLHVPDAGENANLDYALQSKNIELISLPPRGSTMHRFLYPRRFTEFIRQHIPYLDTLLVRGPSPLLPDMILAAGATPTILMIIGDYLAGVDSLPQPCWRKELIRLWSWYNYLGQLRAMKHSLVFVNSKVLYRKFKGKAERLVETLTTTLNEGDFFDRDDTCLTRPIRLLYTGRMDSAKGLLDIVNALSILVAQGEDIVLDLVGWPENGSSILTDISRIANEKKISDRVIYHGYKPVGPELFAFYKQADIYLIASRSSFEGFPRTIWEAMAHSLPVVATRVGSIPAILEGTAELVEPSQPGQLAGAISRLLRDSTLRRAYIRKGMTLTRQNTLEAQTGLMITAVDDWLEKQ